MENPGKLNKKITFYRQVDDEDGERTGQKLIPVRTTYASIKATGGTETYEVERLTNSVSYDIRTRFIPQIFSPELIIGYRKERYEIRSVVNVREEDTELAFTCVKIMKGGYDNGRSDFDSI